MKIGLIDVDGHNFPNLALMRISAWHKAKGDTVEWWQGNLFHYDIIYKSKVFSEIYSSDTIDPWNCDLLIKGGTGYAITTDANGIERYDKSKDPSLPPEIESMPPDYSIYPQYDYAVSMTSRGCPRGCPFCIVGLKEGRCSHKVADVSSFMQNRKIIQCLDPNILACKDKASLLEQYAATGAYVNYNQGLDIRLITDKDIDVLNKTKIKDIHFAWDNPKDNLVEKFRMFADLSKHKPHGSFGTVYVLTNYNTTMQEDLYRIYTLRDLGYDPDVRIYNKPSAPKEIRDLQRWCNNRFIFKSCKTFEEYKQK